MRRICDCPAFQGREEQAARASPRLKRRACRKLSPPPARAGPAKGGGIRWGSDLGMPDQSSTMSDQASNTGAGSMSSGNANSSTRRANRSVTSRLARTAGFHAASTGSASACAAASMKSSSGSAMACTLSRRRAQRRPGRARCRSSGAHDGGAGDPVVERIALHAFGLAPARRKIGGADAVTLGGDAELGMAVCEADRMLLRCIMALWLATIGSAAAATVEPREPAVTVPTRTGHPLDRFGRPGFEPDYRCVHVAEGLAANLAKTDLLHPIRAFGWGILGAAGCFDEHVQARKQAMGRQAVLLVDEGIVDDERAARRKCPIGLFEQQFPHRNVPVVEDTSHDQNVGCGQWIGKEIAWIESEPTRQAVLPHIADECSLDAREIEAATSEMRMNAGDLDRHAALRRADVNDAVVPVPGKTVRE